MSYTDGAYANIANVKADLAYLGISLIRDSIPNPAGGMPYYDQMTALETLAAAGIRSDLYVEPSSTAIATAMQQIHALDGAVADSVAAIEGPNEINNFPVSYDGMTGEPAATAFQTALYAAINSAPATAGMTIYDFTGGVPTPLLDNGALTRNASGSYTLTNGQFGFDVAFPQGVSTITVSYTGPAQTEPLSALFNSPGQGQQTSLYYGKNGTITYTFDNTSSAIRHLYVDFSDYGATDTVTGVKVTASGSGTNLVTFDPSLAGLATDVNMHVYPAHGGAIGTVITATDHATYFGATPGPNVITETGYSTDSNDPNGVTQTVQAQQIINGLLDAYEDGVATTYLYELLDEKSDSNDTNAQMHFGLFNSDNTPKLAAVALHNLTSQLADSGRNAKSFATKTLNYTMSGANAGDQSMLFEKSNGQFDIALWNDGFAGTSSTDKVTLSLGDTYKSISVENLVTGAETSFHNVSHVNVALGADPMLVEISPATVAAASAMVFVAGPAASSAQPASIWAPAIAVPQGSGSFLAPAATQYGASLTEMALTQAQIGVIASLIAHASGRL